MRETAGQKSIKASKDCTRYLSSELADGLLGDVTLQIQECVEKHLKVFEGLKEFCVCVLTCSDPIIPNLMRNKFFALPWLPKPRMNQSCFLFKASSQTFTHLWSLPNEKSAALISTCSLSTLDRKYKRMRNWIDAIFGQKFWETIREEHNIDLLAEEEMIDQDKAKYEKIMNRIKNKVNN